MNAIESIDAELARIHRYETGPVWHRPDGDGWAAIDQAYIGAIWRRDWEMERELERGEE